MNMDQRWTVAGFGPHRTKNEPRARVLFCIIITLTVFAQSAGCSVHFKSRIDREAEMENEKFWESFYTKCGDSYYGEVAPGLSEMRDVSFSVTSLALTGIDKENGYEWKGEGEMRFGRRRVLSFGQWGDWISPRDDWTTGGSLRASLQKKSGTWSGVYSPFDRNIMNNRPSCERIARLQK